MQSDALGQPAVADNVLLHGLQIRLGPDLRVMYPMNVMNFGISGEVTVSGPADPTKIRPFGVILCEPSTPSPGPCDNGQIPKPHPCFDIIARLEMWTFAFF